MMMRRHLSYVLVWTAFYEQLAWAPLLVWLAAAAGDAAAVAPATSAYSLANLIGNLACGFLADRVGRLRVAGSGLVAMSVTALLPVWAATPAALIGTRFLHGLAAAAVAPAALAVVGDRAPDARRGERMARVGLLIAVSALLAPPVTERLAAWLGVAGAAGILAGFLVLVGVTTLALGGSAAGDGAARGRGGRVGQPSPGSLGHSSSTNDQIDCRINFRLVALATAVAFAIMFAQNVLFYAFPLRGRGLGMGPETIGALLSAFAVGAMVAFVPPLSRAADRWGRLRPLTAGLALIAGGLLTLAWSAEQPVLAAALAVYGLGFGLSFPALAALTVDAAGPGQRGLAFGFLTAAFSAGATAGPLVTQAFARTAPPFAVAGVVVALGMALCAVTWRRAGK